MTIPFNAYTFMSMTQQSANRADDASSWSLPRGAARRLSIGPGPRLLKVADGQVWLTTAGNADEVAEDRWLEAGEQVWLAQGDEVVLEAWGEARFQLLVPPSACSGHGAWWDLASTGWSRLTSALLPTRHSRRAEGNAPGR